MSVTSPDGSADPAFEISFEKNDFVDLGLSPNQMAILPLVFMRGEEIRPLGTCFSITNDGLCLTARHVIEDAITLSTPPQRKTELDPERDGLFGALYIAPDVDPDQPNNNIGGFLPMFAIWSIDNLDLALIKLSLPTNTKTDELLRFPSHPLRLKPPERGELAFAMGYREMNWTLDSAQGVRTLKQAFSATKGVIEEVHLGGRDKVMLPFPCFRMSGRVDSGMSGGPIFDANGRVFAVVCSSIPRGDDERDSSYGSLVAPAMGMTLDGRDPGGPERQAFLWDFVEGGALDVDRENVKVTRDHDNIDFALQGFAMKSRLGS